MSEAMRTFAKIAGLTEPKIPRRYSGIVTEHNDDGSYQVFVQELNVTYPRVNRSGPDRRRLLPRDRVALFHTGVVLEIL